MQIDIPSASTPIDDHAGLSTNAFEEWCGFLRLELSQLQVHPQGLGAWQVSLAADLLPDQGAETFVHAVRDAARAPFRIELVTEAAGEDGPIDQGWLGAYSSRSHDNKVHPCPVAQLPVIRLHVDRIADTAKNALGCSIWRLAGVVLRHELGHHVSQICASELRRYDSSKTNPETCRPEAAAQLFAWLTSDSDDRLLMDRMDPIQAGKGPSAYTAYRHFLNFAAGDLAINGSGATSVGAVRPGWMMAWQLVQKPKQAAFQISSRISCIEEQRHSIRNQIEQIVTALGQPSAWPMLTALGHEFHQLTAGFRVAAIGLPKPLNSCVALALSESDLYPAREQISEFHSAHLKDGLVFRRRSEDETIKLWVVSTAAEVTEMSP